VSDADDDAGIPHPRATTLLAGHAEAERQLLAAYAGGRMPHAWLIGGEAGIGKATLTYRLARFVLAHPDPAAPAVQSAQDLFVAPDHPIARRVAARAHSDLLALERTVGDTGKLRTEIAVDDVRRTVRFFGSTAGEGGWRICIVDSADELNRFGANALLKILEEPPARALLLVISQSPARLLPTIRSRCRRLALRPLEQPEVLRAAATALAVEAADKDLQTAATLAQGSVARALALYDGPTLALREKVVGLLQKLPQIDPQALHALGDSLGRADEAAFVNFVDTVRGWLSEQLDRVRDTARLARVADAWEAFNRQAGEVDEYNLDRKPLVFSTFALLAEAARR
jgi:DNA polymerase III subunit delta'